MASESLPTSPTAAPPPAVLGTLGRRSRPSLSLRWRSFWKRAKLDQALAAGEDPLASDSLLWRAQRLTEPKQRIAFADTIHRIVDETASGGPPKPPGPPVIRPHLIANNRALLLTLAERLRDGSPLNLRGLAMVELLVRYGGSPLYRGPSPLQLKLRLLEVLEALDPHDHSWAD
jgi:hypothetical protein